MYTSYTFGSLIGAYFIEMKEPQVPYAITFVLAGLQSFQAWFFAKELETNEQATTKDKETMKYELRKS